MARESKFVLLDVGSRKVSHVQADHIQFTAKWNWADIMKQNSANNKANV